MAATVPGLTIGAIILSVLSGLGTVYIEVTHNDRETAQKVAALEAKAEAEVKRTDGVDSRLDRIENKIDKLVEWAIGAEKTKK